MRWLKFSRFKFSLSFIKIKIPNEETYKSTPVLVSNTSLVRAQISMHFLIDGNVRSYFWSANISSH